MAKVQKVPLYSIAGKEIGQVDLPPQFAEPVRPDIIKRAVLAAQSNSRQPYGTDPAAGFRTTAKMKTLRRAYGSWTGRGIARQPRIRAGSGGMTGVVRRAAHAKKGRHPTPPLVERVWPQKINRRERRKAIRSALAATAYPDLVKSRGHRVSIERLPMVVEEKVEEMKKAKDVVALLKSLGLETELERAKEKKVRSGKGKMRGRKYRTRTGPLIVVGQDKGIARAARAAGVDVAVVNSLGAELLAPGTRAGRLAIFSKPALEKLEKEKLFAGE